MQLWSGHLHVKLQSMALPFHVSCSESAVGLYELADGRFQLIEDGPITPLMVGPGYVLAENRLADHLREFQLERVRFVPATIWHRRTGQEFHTHERLVVGQQFFPDQINDLNLDGFRLLSLDGEYLFASPDLAHQLRASEFSYLRFSEGMKGWAANAI